VHVHGYSTWFIHCVSLGALQEGVHVEARQIDTVALCVCDNLRRGGSDRRRARISNPPVCVCHSSSLLPGAATGGGERRRPLFRARSRSAGSAGASAAQRKPLFSVALFVPATERKRGQERDERNGTWRDRRARPEGRPRDSSRRFASVVRLTNRGRIVATLPQPQPLRSPVGGCGVARGLDKAEVGNR
jgi:hypothetical protein